MSTEGVAAEGEEPAAAGESSRPWPGNLLAFGHLAVLCSFALAQPLFNLLQDNPEFFAARGSTAGEIIVFALLLVIVPPVVLFAIEFAVGLVSEPARRIVHVVLCGGVASVIFIQALKKSIDASDGVLIFLALALGAGGALLYWRAEPIRSFVSVLTPAPIVFLVIFLFISPVHELTIAGDADAKSASGGTKAPIVFLGLDEFPGTDLIGADGKIDAERYPGFAELAQEGTWFPNAHSIYDSTTRAWPAIMDGDYPTKDKRLPTPQDHPNSIFSVLGDDYVMNVSEEATSVCPTDLCKDARLDEPFLDRLKSMADDLSLVYKHVVAPPGIENDLESVSETWGDFGGGGEGSAGGGTDAPSADAPDTKGNLQGNRNKRLEEWIASIKPTKRPSLNFKHVLLPHVPWQYLPDGRQYRRVATEPIPGIGRQAYKDQGQDDVLQQRHLLQVGFADHEVQRLIKRLKDTGMWDKSLVVVTADHGVSFRKDQFDRRKVTAANADEIAPVPLFIKAPGQKKGVVNDSVVETTDVLPTIADILDFKLPAKTDGKSAFSAAVRDRDTFQMLKRDLSGWIRMPASEFARRKQAKIDERIAKFGEGKDGPDRIYRIGPNQDLIGKAAAPLESGTGQGKASIVDSGEYRNVDLRSATVPIWVTGRVSGGPGPPRDIAVAVNGKVAAVGNTLRLATGGGEIYGVLVPPSSFKQGRNDVVVYAVENGRLAKLGSS